MISRRTVLHMRGFSLTEVMVVVAILGIGSIMVVPNMLNLNRDARLSSHADQLMGMLSDARMQAINLRRNIVVCPAGNANTAAACSANAADWSNGVLIMDGATVVRRMALPADVTITQAAATVTFNQTIGNSAAATFNVCVSGRRQQNVAVAASGRVSKSVTNNVCA